MSGDVPRDPRSRNGDGSEAALSAEERAEELKLDEFVQRTDWEAWSTAPVPSGFAQRVVARRERAPSLERDSVPLPGGGAPRAVVRVRRGTRAVGTAVLLAALVMGSLVMGLPVLRSLLLGSREWAASLLAHGKADGHLRAEVRTELSIGRRAVAVLEPGAELSWHGDRVEQQRGSVFYRVSPGGDFRVSTPDGGVEVLGTCFGVDAGERGRRATRVAVYEGRVQVSVGRERVELRAGQSARLSADGVEVSEGSAALGARAAAVGRPADEPVPPPGVDPRAGVEALRRQLDRVEEQKKALENELRSAEAGLRQLRDAPPPRHPFDLTREDWKALAVQGTVKFRVPCSTLDWKISREALDDLGLAPDDAAPLEAAYARSRERLWEVLRPLCVEALGSEKAPEILGRTGCINGILGAARQSAGAATEEAMHEVGEIRAGLRDAPDPAIADNPALQALLVLTAEPARFEAELTEVFGPEEARRLAYSEALCRTELHFAGPGPRKAKGNGHAE
jgi:FecR-like protein